MNRGTINEKLMRKGLGGQEVYPLAAGWGGYLPLESGKAPWAVGRNQFHVDTTGRIFKFLL